MGTLEGKNVLITGAARGQGRSHAVRLAAEGANVIALDICRSIDSVPYPLATPEDLEETRRQVELAGGKAHLGIVDVRDRPALADAVATAVDDLGPIDIVLANAGIAPMSLKRHPDEWRDVIEVNLTGVYNTIDVVVPDMVRRGAGGAIVITSSTAGLNGVGGNSPGGLGYTASKHALVGLMRAYANYLAPHDIRVNTVHPTGVETPMIMNAAVRDFLEKAPRMADTGGNALRVPHIQPIDVSNAIAWLVSDAARYVTGVALPVDAGFTNNR